MKNITKKFLLLILISFANAQIPSNAGQFQYDCIAVNLTARLVIPVDREQHSNAPLNTSYIAYDVPLRKSKVMFGSCGIDMNAIVVNWVDMNNSGGMKLTFTFNRAEKKYTLSEIAFYFSAAVLHIDDSETLNIFYRGDILESPMGQSYCPRANYSLPLINEYRNRSIPLGTLELYSLCFEAHSICEDQLFCDYSSKSIIIASSIIGAIALSTVFICLLCFCRCITRCFKGYTPI